MNYIVRQRDIKDCGVCCVKSLIIYYGGYVSMSRLRLDTYADKNGTNALNLIRALKKYNFEAMGKKVKVGDLGKLSLPCIAHMEYKNGLTHFVVILKVLKSKVLLMDPAKGKVYVDKQKFLEDWSSVVILAYPTSEVPKLPKEKGVMFVLEKVVEDNKRLFSFLLWFSFLFTFCTVFLSFFYRFCFEQAQVNYSFDNFILLISIYGSFTLLKLFLVNIKDNIKNVLSKNVETKFIYAFIRHLLFLPLRQFLTYTKGELLARLEEEESIQSAFIDLVTTCYINIFLAFLALVVILSYNYLLGLIIALGIFLYLIYSLIKGKRLYVLILRQMDMKGNWNTALTEMLGIFTSMKFLNQTMFILEKVEEKLVGYLKLNYDTKQKIRKQNFWKMLILEATFFSVTAFGIYLVGTKKLLMFDFILIESLMSHFIDPLRQLIDMIPSFYYIKGLFSKVLDFQSIDEEALLYPKEFLNGALEVKDLSFSYDGYTLNVDHVNFKVKKGGHVLLVGKSGCGKSTICLLLQRHLDGYNGTITIKRKNILDYSVATIRNNITYLSQKEVLIDASIEENILFGRDISDKKFLEVCEICQIESIVGKRRFRYQEMIRSSDCNLSGGERQRIILARALLNESAIYMFDEVLSEVDESLEALIIEPMLKYLEKKTVLYISHRPIVKFFDEVIKIGNE